MVIPTTGLSFRSPSHRLHNGCGSGAGGENTATTVPMYSPSTSTTRTKPPGCPVRSLTVCHRPAGVDACPRAGPHQTRMRTKRSLSNPYGLLYEQMHASCFIKLDLDGKILFNPTEYDVNRAGFIIHSAIHRA